MGLGLPTGGSAIFQIALSVIFGSYADIFGLLLGVRGFTFLPKYAPGTCEEWEEKKLHKK